jgi:membrane associated rhomboid family serine protease
VKNYLAKQIYKSILYPLLFVILLWLSFLLQSNFNSRLINWGVLPREASGLKGILTSVFIHGDLGHIASNTLPILVLGMMLFYFYKKIAKQTFFWIWLISGIWLWIGGRNHVNHPTFHIGASTLIYGLATFLFFSGVFRKHLQLMVVSALVLFLYGSILWGIFPLKTEISWEGHLFGALAGVLVAFNYRKEGPQRRVYQWEEEEETDDTENHSPNNPEDENNSPQTSGNITINYIFKPDKEN